MSFATIALGDIRHDCRFYSGYKPCNKHDGCPGCPHFEARGEQVLVIKVGAMGDVLRTKSLLPALKRAHPQSWIVWVTAAGSEPIARDPLVDEVRPFTFEGVMAVEGRRYARMLCLDKEAPALALGARVDAALRQGYAPTEHGAVRVWNEGSADALRLGLSDEFKFRLNRKSHPRILHDIAELPYDGASYGLVVRPEARARAAGVLGRIGVPGGVPLVGLNTGCGPVFETKAWTLEGYAELVSMLAARGVAMMLLGGRREEPLHRELMRRGAAHAGSLLFDSGTENDLETFFALVERCDAVLSSDSLAMHVAIALRRPTVAFFGPTCEQEVDLFGLGEKIVTDFACSPCYLKRCDKNPTCMQAMRAEDVAAALGRVLAAARDVRAR